MANNAVGSLTPSSIGNDSYLDMQGLAQLRASSRKEGDRDAALHAAAKQMEGMFMNMMLKSMRQANEAFSQDGLFENKEGQMFRDMLDQQYSMRLSSRYDAGLAVQIERQLNPTKFRKPTELDRTGGQQGFPLQGRQPGGMPLQKDSRSFELPETGPREFPLSGLRPVMAPDLMRDLSLINKSQSASQCEVDASSPQKFVDSIRPYAEQAGQALGVDPRAIVAQAALETGWGKHMMRDASGSPSYNLFGIKADSAWSAERVAVETTEYRANTPVREVADFRRYGSLADAFKDYVSFIKGNPRYENALRNGANAGAWGVHLQQAGYATDPAYGKKIASLVKSDEISGIPGV